ncbi:hypothetical protein KEJ27_02875 [Candidatus Bathyarchaeota archaeon]|nr:hypothetical protein [Candidatus Bathyarchaeota archaeon]MBS7612625.1 hypothetical protein [Candidatus Bathyarchaeota archaeon]MBS7617209.1 hypothetical protein [Candidatus Bathyarchaeota archaeon]
MTIEVDDAGWGDLVGGCVIVVRRVETGEYYVGEIPVEFFQEPKFKIKQYLDKAVEIVENGLRNLKVPISEEVRMCTGFVLSKARKNLSQQGYKVASIKIVGETQKLAEQMFLKTLEKIGLKLAEGDPRRRFQSFLKWVEDEPEFREKYVKTGWGSWKNKWRTKIFESV